MLLKLFNNYENIGQHIDPQWLDWHNCRVQTIWNLTDFVVDDESVIDICRRHRLWCVVWARRRIVLCDLSSDSATRTTRQLPTCSTRYCATQTPRRQPTQPNLHCFAATDVPEHVIVYLHKTANSWLVTRKEQQKNQNNSIKKHNSRKEILLNPTFIPVSRRAYNRV